MLQTTEAAVSKQNGLLHVQEVSKHFGGLAAVSKVSFSLGNGEILGLIGPNGAGKTTLFNLVNGVYPVDEGTITFAGRCITHLKPHAIVHLGIARTHQIVKPLNEMTVLDNVMVGACFGREHSSLQRARDVALEVLNSLGMADRAYSRAKSLTISGKKRLEIARALAARPKLLLLDEVLAGLNPTEIEHMISLVRRIRDSGISVLMIEHVMQAMMKLADRIIVLNLGSKLAEGTPQQVANNRDVIDAYLGAPDFVDTLRRRTMTAA